MSCRVFHILFSNYCCPEPVKAVKIRPKTPLVFLHIPKCAGTNLNIQLKAVAKRIKVKYCEIRTTDVHTKKLPAATLSAKSGGGCGIVSGEFDVSILNSMRKAIGTKHAAPQPITFLRDPIQR